MSKLIQLCFSQDPPAIVLFEDIFSYLIKKKCLHFFISQLIVLVFFPLKFYLKKKVTVIMYFCNIISVIISCWKKLCVCVHVICLPSIIFMKPSIVFVTMQICFFLLVPFDEYQTIRKKSLVLFFKTLWSQLQNK